MGEPIAIVGMACRLPGADSVDELWDLLAEGRDATSETPADRFPVDLLHSSEPAPGKIISRRSGYLDGIDRFDAEFFGLSATEADDLDPQQRLLMTTTWEALEDAGIPFEHVAGTRTGVYVGAVRLDYWELAVRRGLTSLTGSLVYNNRSVLSGRLSYTFDLLGPSITLDTACSSSLVAVHLACQSLRAGETTMAIAAGINLKLVPDEDIVLSQIPVLAPDGRCKFGDARADGFAASDGVGVVVLKPLSRARADGDRIRAVLIGSTISNDGASGGSLLAPSVEAHAQMLRWAYENAGVRPADIDYIEAHGTGTPLIDPVEFTALGEVLAEGRPADQPCFVGSIKTNIGHTEGAAGVASLIKTVLCLEHRQVVPSLHFTVPNPAIPWEELPLVVPTRLEPLPDRARPAIAGISGQGISAVNTHLVVREADPVSPGRSEVRSTRNRHLLLLSARTPAALNELVARYVGYLGPGGVGRKHELADICFSAAKRRHHHLHRLAVIAESHDGMVAKLEGGGSTAPEPDSRLMFLAERYLMGRSVEWGNGQRWEGRYVPLPTYPWQNRSHWLTGVGRD
ncbi:type I polyketide synthase [Allokutzneria albata]|uniref:type I polyketide synthase n=1 Tax=Allokutzneria albata TaxID=211114 RepID=UPI000A5F0DFB|nr:polyketide synthase [Allokutzneria albata]